MTRVAAVILAAGASSRLGEPKQMAMLGAETLLDRAIAAALAAGASPVIVVLGANRERILAGCRRLDEVRVVVNREWAHGLATSICCGVAALEDELAGAILMTCDQPALTANHLRRLATGDCGEMKASRYGGRSGVPAYFPASCFAGLMLLQGDSGARSMLDAADAIEFPGGELDVDTPAALLAVRDAFA